MDYNTLKTDLSDLIVMPFIKWTVESQGICLINTRSGNSKYLAYPQAALWDLLVRGYTYNQIVNMLSAIASINKEMTAVLIQDSIVKWLESSFLAQDLNHG